MLSAADSYLALVKIDAHAATARPRPEFACSFKVIHAGEMNDAERYPGNFDAAASYDFGGNLCQSLVEPRGFLISAECSIFSASL
jgi:hypothetical protein